MKKLYLILLLAFTALGFAGYIFWKYFYLATLTLDVLPPEAAITLNSKPVFDKRLSLPKGDYTVEVKAPGYRSQTFTFSANVGNQIMKRIELIALPRPRLVVDGPTQALATSPDRKNLFFSRDNVLYYLPLTDNANQPAVPITPQLTGLQSIDWSPDFGLAILKKEQDQGIYDFNRYDLLHQEYRSLPAELKATAWDATGNSLYAQKVTTSEQSVVKVNRAGQEQNRLADLNQIPFKDLAFLAGPPNIMVIWSANLQQNTDLILFDAFQRLFVPLTDSGRATGPVFSPKRDRIAYLDSGELVITELNGKNKRNLTVRPRLGNYQFLDDETVAVFTANQVSLVNINTGMRENYEIYAPSEAITDLVALPDKKTLFYLYQGRLYQIIYRQ